MESDYKRRARHSRRIRKYLLTKNRNKSYLQRRQIRRVPALQDTHIPHIQSYPTIHEDGNMATRICTTHNIQGPHIQSHSTVHEDGTVTTITDYAQTLNFVSFQNLDTCANACVLNMATKMSTVEHNDIEDSDGTSSWLTSPFDHLTDTDLESSMISKRQHELNSDDDDSLPRKFDAKWDFGDPNGICSFCGAILWYEERSEKSKRPRNPEYSICCQKGAIQLPLLKETPPFLKGLLDYNERKKTSIFRQNIRAYNSMFAFTSMGGQVDKRINDGHGPYVFRLNGQNHHRIGSLLPATGQKPRFAQLYIYDTENEVSNRLNAVSGDSESNRLDANIVNELMKMLDENNQLTKVFRMARDRFKDSDLMSVRLKIIGTRRTDARQYNLPTASEVAALIVGDGYQNDDFRDVIVEENDAGLKRINEIHPSFMAMQYPLLFPYGEDGFTPDIPLRRLRKKGKGKRNKVSLREYYAYRIQQRHNEGQTVIRGGRLYQQFLVDAYACIEEYRLRWVKKNQNNLRADLYNGLQDTVVSADTRAVSIGKRIVLPASFTGGPRYMVQNYQDAIAICRWAGPPDLFITFTCNPKWIEVERFLKFIPRQKSQDRTDVVTRVFKIKLHQLMNDLRNGHHFGRIKAGTYTIEFQKRGLPHAHILLFLYEADKPSKASDIDKFISAELPNEAKDPLGFEMVTQFMIHGPCGTSHLFSPCMVNDNCCKHFPKKFNCQTVIDDNGFPSYQRRKNSRMTLKSGIEVDNQWVVPYNRDLIVKYEAHINVEYCNQTRAVKYLFKYVNKGNDRATIVIQNNVPQQDSTMDHTVREVDEIKTYLDCRYVSASEATWRILDFEIHFRKPAVERLSFHLPGENQVVFKDTDYVINLQKRKDLDTSKFTRWMDANKLYADARELTYTEFPTKWTWDRHSNMWGRRKSRKKETEKIGRIFYVHPTSGENFYLRLLLNFVKGATKFEDIRTIDGILYPDFKSACSALGLLDDDNEWHEALQEASHSASGHSLREMFVTLLLFCEVTDPSDLWNKQWMLLSDDILSKQRRLFHNYELLLTEEQIKNYTLLEIEKIMNQCGKSLQEFQGIPFPNISLETQFANKLVREELAYDHADLDEVYLTMFSTLNTEQKRIFTVVTEAVNQNVGGMFFVYGSGGTGKTFLWNTIIAKLRSEGKIVIAVASSGIASLLLPGGKTAHSRFKIPIDLDQFSSCDIKQQTHLAELIRQTDLIVWDEAPMLNRNIFEAVDRTFRDLMRPNDNASEEKLFGGKCVLLGGDFRQILPVILKGTRETVVGSAICRSPIWKHCHVFCLTTNMRLRDNSLDDDSRRSLSEFSEWVLNLGDGKLPAISLHEHEEPTWIQIPDDILIPVDDNPIKQIVECTYPNLSASFGDIEYLKDRCILAPTNECVDEVNSFVIASLPGELNSYYSADSISPISESIANQDILYPTEFLNTLEFSGMPTHKLQLKIGVPIMIIRNLNHSIGLCNGTRLIITRLANKLIEGKIITGTNIGQKVLIPRIVTSSNNDTKWPFILRRRQFPIKICFAMTINKSQGQTLKNVGIYLPRPVFSHGQLYVAVSRTTSRAGLKILIVNKENEPQGYTQNIVYPEVFNDLY